MGSIDAMEHQKPGKIGAGMVDNAAASRYFSEDAVVRVAQVILVAECYSEMLIRLTRA